MKPWYKVVTPREDLREGKPLDAAEFAVHLRSPRKAASPSRSSTKPSPRSANWE